MKMVMSKSNNTKQNQMIQFLKVQAKDFEWKQIWTMMQKTQFQTS